LTHNERRFNKSIMRTRVLEESTLKIRA